MGGRRGSEGVKMIAIQVPQRDITRFYILVMGLDLFFIAATLLNDLGVTFPIPFIARQLNLEKEVNLATWYSSALLFMAGLVAFANSRLTLPDIGAAHWYRLGWLGISFVCVWLAADETSQFHENLGRWYTQSFGTIPGLTEGQEAKPVYAWLLLLLPAILATAVGMFLFFRLCFARYRVSWRTAHAGLLCWVGAIVAEYAESQMRHFSVSRGVQGTIEEGLEIVGTTFLLFAFTEFLRAQSHVDPSSLEVKSKRKSRGQLE